LLYVFVDDSDDRVVERRGDGMLVYFVGGYYEYSVRGSETHTVKYYGKEAMRVDNDLRFILTDHLSSTSVVTDANGNYLGGQRYDAPSGSLGTGWGSTRYVDGAIPTDKVQKRSFCLAEWHAVPFCTYTGQRLSRDIELYDYRARWGACPERQRRNPLLGRFLMEDTIIPDQGVMRLDRYSGMKNNPVRFTDPTGHMVPCLPGDICEHSYEQKPLNPWRQAPEKSMIGRDKTASLNDDNDQLFLNHVRSPLRSTNPDYRNFGSNRGKYEGDKRPSLDRFHVSIDAGHDGDLAVYALAYGKVISSGWSGDLGYFILVEHEVNGEKFYSVYAHLGKDNQNNGILVTVGQTVDNNTIIGLTGNTKGNTIYIDPHLHFEVRREANVNLKSSDPFSGLYFWGYYKWEFARFFLDLGSIFDAYDKDDWGEDWND
jgi:RHS repeat-associated protein